jgi:uncharacterized protein YihD (DUF1040 family)
MDKFTFLDFLHILIGAVATGSVLLLIWLVQDYFKFKFDYARESLTREKWEELCKEYRTTCDARLCVKLDKLAKTMDGCSTSLVDLTREMTIVQTKMGPQAEKIKEIDKLKVNFVRLETEFEKYKSEVDDHVKKNT